MAVVGEGASPRLLSEVLFEAPHSLRDQARHPHHQTTGRDNPDGWGVAWYPLGAPEPELYRTATAIWDDDAFVTRAPAISCTGLLAAARLASPGAAVVETGNAPFTSGAWAFSLNGFVAEFRHGAGDALRAHLGAERVRGLAGDTDSEVLFGLVLDRVERGCAPDAALADVVALVTSITTGRLNLLLTDGRAVHATRYGNSLFRRGGSMVASEPLDGAPAWVEVPDQSRWSSGPGAGSAASL